MLKKVTKSEIMGPLIAFAVIFLLATVTTPQFCTLANLRNQILQICVTAFLAIGATLVILTGGIDISCGAAVAMLTMTFAGMCKFWGLSVWTSMGITLICGIVMGLLNGVLVAYVHIPPFIATLATQGIFRGIAFMINGGSALNRLADVAEDIFYTKIFGVIPITLVYILVAYAAVYLFLKYSQLGRKIYAVGGNASAAKLSGIAVNRVLLFSYLLAGLFTAIAAILMACRLNSGSQTYGSGMEMSAIAAAVIGGASMVGGKGNIVSTFIGAATVLVVQNVLNLNSIPTSFQYIANGIMILIAVSLDIWRPQMGALLKKFKKRSGESDAMSEAA